MQPDNSNLMFVFPFHRSGNRKQKDDLFFFQQCLTDVKSVQSL